jgi:hypothetical protein
MIDDPIGELAHPDIDKGENQPLFAAVMLVDGGKTDPGSIGDIPDTRFVEIGVGKNIQYRCLEPLVDIRVRDVLSRTFLSHDSVLAAIALR